MTISAELLVYPPSPKVRFGKVVDLPGQMFANLLSQARLSGVKAARTPRYVGKSDWLILYGPGGLDRVEPMAAQRKKGGRVICWDAAYWDRKRKLRVSIDHAHPQHYVMRRVWPADRLAKDRIKPKEFYDPKGPVLIASVGTKSRAQYGAETIEAWEQATVDACLAKWPNRRIWYRPKPHHPATVPRGAALLASVTEIDSALAGASLLATWHSNVAVDAIRLGIPVVCVDGAAAAVASPHVPDEPVPLPLDVRDRFLENLAYFQWAPTEAAQVWIFLRELLR